ncbi:MAG: flagellar hook-length control protein FliK, partial [Acetatifactor sp.]|nr:flagellar hook-length control protein FliK [Acetatifactor sp.]
DNMMQALNELQLPPEEAEALSEAVQRFGRGELSAGDFFRAADKMLDAAVHTEDGVRQMQKLFGGKAFQNILTSQLKEMWTLRPEDVSQPEKVGELYRRIDRQMKGLMQALEAGGQENSTAYRAAANLSQNVDFMNQINQMYTYVQLPLHLQQSEAHGDLYVYTNKRNLARNDGQVSALLHLDMEHLGPLDVYVTLQEAKVSTKFYVANDEILDFIEAHMDILTKRLEKRGYSCSVSMTTRGEKKEQEGGGLTPLLQQEKGILLSQYAFDVRT